MRSNRKKIIKVFLFVLVIGLVAGLTVSAVWGYRVYAKVTLLESLLIGLRDIEFNEFETEDFSKTLRITEYINTTLTDLNSDLEPFLPVINRLGFLPFVGKYAQYAEPLLDYSLEMTNAAVQLGRTFEPLVETTNGINLRKMPQILSDFMQDNQGEFAIAEFYLNKAAIAREKIDDQVIPNSYREQFLRLDSILTHYPLIFQSLRALPGMLGADDPTTYLLLVQNNDEIRATGGYISAYGLLQLKDGRIMVMEFQDSSQIEYISEIRPAPKPMQQIMFAHYLLARDANWSPDFPTAAELTQEMYSLSTGLQTDGVIAFDQQLIVDFLNLFGEIQLPGEEVPIDASNVELKMIEYRQAAIDERRSKERKDFLMVIAPHLFKKFFEIENTQEILDLADFFEDAIVRGHLLIYLNDPEAQDVLNYLSMDSRVNPGDGDFLMAIDSNVGIGKVDLYIDRSLSYTADLSDPEYPLGEIRLTLRHTEPGDNPCTQGNRDDHPNYYKSECYWDYWRILTPQNTEFTNIDFEPVPDEYFHERSEWDNKPSVEPGENGTSMVGGLTVVPQLEQKEVVINTALPSTIVTLNESGNLIYKLRIQKQPGIVELPLTLRVIPPEGYTLGSLPEVWVYDQISNMYIWEGEIDRTKEFVLEFSADNLQ